MITLRETAQPVVAHVEVDGESLDVEVSVRRSDSTGRRTRVYVSLDDAAAAHRRVRELLPRDDAGNVRYTTRGEFPDVDRAFDRSNREQVRAWRVVGESAFALWDAEFRASFSRRAGCACGCSPGFVLSDSTGFDVWLSARVVSAKVPAPTT